MFAGLIDVQDRTLLNRSYTTGHKAYRARATVELGDADRLGERARRPLCGRARHRGRAALVLDLRDGLQRRHALHRRQKRLRLPLWRNTRARARLLRNTGPLGAAEAEALDRGPGPAAEPAYSGDQQAAAGRQGPRHILDVIQLGAAQVMLETQDRMNFSMPQHMLRVLQHARLVLRQLRPPAAAEAALRRGARSSTRTAWHQARTGDLRRSTARTRDGADRMSGAAAAERIGRRSPR